MRYTPSLLDKLLQMSSSHLIGETSPGLTLEEVKDSVAADLEALLNTRCAMNDREEAEYPLSAQSVVNFGVSDFSSRSLSSGLDRDFICESIRKAIEQQDRRLQSIQVRLDGEVLKANRLSFTIRAILRVSEVGEQVSFDARFEPTLQRYSVARRSAVGW